MSLFFAFLLGLIQGLTEFLPISSTGHLVLIEHFLKIPSVLSFDAFMHLGSFLAILIYFWKDLKEIWNYKWLIFVAILPGGIAGLVLEHFISEHLRIPVIIGAVLILMSIPMILGEIFGKKEKEIKDLSIFKSLILGFAQALALIPGTSRSGITISTGLLLGLKRDESAKFSFLIGAPLLLGAGLYEGTKLIKTTSIPLASAFTGFVSATIFSVLAIAFLIPFLKKHSLYSFVIYRIALGLIILLLAYL